MQIPEYKITLVPNGYSEATNSLEGIRMLPIILSTMTDPNDREFIHNLYVNNEKLLLSIALKIVPSLHDAEEVVQESLLKLIGKVATLQKLECCTLTAYVVLTVRNTAFNYMNKLKRHWAKTEEFDEVLLGEKVPSSLTNKSLSALCLKRFVGYYANLARTALALSTERIASGIMIE